MLSFDALNHTEMKRILPVLGLLFIIHSPKAQTVSPPVFADVDTNFSTYVSHVFGALENNRVATGLLVDYGIDFTNPRIYNGVTLVDSTLIEQGLYSDLYKAIYTSRINNNASTLRHPTVHDSLCYVSRSRNRITLSGLLFKYNSFDPTALANGKIQIINGQYRDVYLNSVWQNPYEELTTMAISPSIISYSRTNVSVLLPSNLFLSNMSQQIQNIQFDADDGLGYRNLNLDISLNLNYTDTGWRHWVFKVILGDGRQLFSHTKVHFCNSNNIGSRSGNSARGTVIGLQQPIFSTEQFNGQFGAADIIVSFRNANDPVIRRPLIVAEGFDPGHITDPEEDQGESTFEEFIRTVQFSGSNALQDLISDDPSEFDIVYVNWRNGTDWLERNALVLEEVIRWVNLQKQNDLVTGNRNPNIVLGSSMGGVIARMALGRMERLGGGVAAHETNLYVSLDAPHQGANIPLGYQALARHATRMYIRTGILGGIVEVVQLIRNGPSPLMNLLLLDQPASRQLINNRINLFYNQANDVNQDFLEDLRTEWEYPAIRNVAISNGSECGTGQEFLPGSTLLYHYRSTKTRLIGDLIFMTAGIGLGALAVPNILVPFVVPGSNKFELTLDVKAVANGGSNQVYYGNVKLTKTLLWVAPISINIANKAYAAPSGMLPVDTYPGGFYNVTVDDQPGAVSQDWMFSYDNSFFLQRRFSYIHTTSALDIGSGNTPLTHADFTRTYVGGNPPAPPLNSPFANFTTAYNITDATWQFDNNTRRRLINEPHETFF